MCGYSNLEKRGAVYYARIATPKALKDARALAGKTGKGEVWRSLRTKDKTEAKRLLRGVLDAIEAEWDRELRALTSPVEDLPPGKHIPTDVEVRAAVREAMERYRDADEAKRAKRERAASLAKATAIKAQLMQGLSIGEGPSAVDRLLSRIAEDNAFHLPAGSEEYNKAHHLLTRGLADLMRVIERRNEGDFTADFADPAMAAPTEARTESAPRASSTKPKHPAIMELLEQHLRDRRARLSPEQLQQKRAAVRDFVELFGARRPVEEIDRAALREFKLALTQYPVRARLHDEFKGLTFPAIVERNKQLKLPTIKDKTLNTTLSHLGAFCKWLGAHGYIPDGDVIGGLHIAVNKREGTRESYSAAELTKIFALPLFRGAATSEQVSKPGPVRIRDHRFWLPLISLYTGARLGEIAQLETADVAEIDGIPTFTLRLEGETAKSLKTKYSERPVPVHSELIRLGFLDFVASQRKAKRVRVFPDLQPGARTERLSETAGKSFRRYLERAGLKGFGYHRFRHTVHDALRAAGYLDEQIAAIVGHKGSGTQTARYGSVSSVTLAQRKQMIDSIEYPGLDFTAWYPVKPKS